MNWGPILITAKLNKDIMYIKMRDMPKNNKNLTKSHIYPMK